MKRVYLDVAGRMHSLYRMLLEQPPEGYVVRRDGGAMDRAFSKAASRDWLFKAVVRHASRIAPPNLVKARLERFKRIPGGTDLTFANGHLVFRNEPWVVDMEFATQLAGYDARHFARHRRLIEKRLAHPDCRAIMSWTEAGARTILDNTDSAPFRHKVHVTPLAARPKPALARKDEGSGRTILFVGSVNIPGQFELKGGMEVVAAFERLRDEFPDARLVIRSDMPDAWRARCRRDPRIVVEDGIVDEARLDAMFREACLFWFPAYNTPGLAILDAMSYELPVVATDVWANAEMVRDGETGVVIPGSRRVPFVGANVPAWGEPSFVRSLREPDPRVVDDLVSATRRLLLDDGLRREMGRVGRREVERGRYSIGHRNAILKKIFDGATA